MAAASIAQVHKAKVRMPDGTLKPVAVKVLRPGIEQRFQKDLDSYVFAARMIERFHQPSRRLRPIAVVDTLAKSVAIEMDLRMEAAAISEMAENTKNDEGFRVPQVDWTRSARRVLTLEWIDGIPIADRDALAAAGHDVKPLGALLMQTFLRHAMRDGFFHADMHPGNLFVDDQGRIVAVDFGIMGRLGMKERRFLAEILYGFLNRNYHPRRRGAFRGGLRAAQAFGRAIRPSLARHRRADHGPPGERDLHGAAARPAVPIYRSVRHADAARAAAAAKDHGGGRGRRPQPRSRAEYVGRVRAGGEGVDGADASARAPSSRPRRKARSRVGRFMGEIPKLLGQAERTAEALSAMAEDGLRLDDHTVERLAEAQARESRASRIGIWIGALALAAIALALLF